MKRARSALTATRLKRLHDVFQLTIVDEVRVSPVRTKDEATAYREAIRNWLNENPYRNDVDIAFVLHEGEEAYRQGGRGASPYYAAKAAFLKAGIPEQSIQYRNLTDEEFGVFEKFRVTNILVAAYAKIGGTPWVIQEPGSATDSLRASRPDITIGVATTSIRGGDDANRNQRFVGISTIFRENGSFALWQTTAPQRDLDSYEDSLESSVRKSILEFEEREGRRVERIACHVSGKRAGKRERDAIHRALEGFSDRSIVADLVHVSDDASLWLFDGRDTSHRPEPGFLATLSTNGKQALMHTDGRTTKGPIRFPTRPLRVGVYSETPDGEDANTTLGRCLEIYQHMYELRWMSWRGVRASSEPVSVAYPRSMSKLLAYLYDQEQMDVVDILPSLHDKAWFL